MDFDKLFNGAISNALSRADYDTLNSLNLNKGPDCREDIDRTSPVYSVTKKAYEYYVNAEGLTIEKLKLLDRIDARKCLELFDYSFVQNGQRLPEIKNMDEMFFNKVFSDYTFFDQLPCFEKGVVRYNTKAFIFFRIDELDVDNQEAIIYCQAISHSALDGYECGACFEIVINGEYTHYRYAGLPIDCISSWLDENYDSISIEERKIAKQIIKTGSSPKYMESYSSVIRWNVKLFWMTIVYMNRLFEQQTLSKGRSESKTHPVADTKYVQNPTQERMVRRLGNIEITSEKKPRKPTEAYIRHYSVATWKCRATVRHLKSGKVVRVRECVKHRKALVGNNEPLPVTIQMK